jgi:hypothetical protein
MPAVPAVLVEKIPKEIGRPEGTQNLPTLLSG